MIDTAYGNTVGSLGARVNAGATLLTSSVGFPAGSSILIDATGSNPEAALIASVSGSGPYTIQLNSGLKYGHQSGAALSNYPTKSAGFDPALMDPRAFCGVPMLILAAFDGSDLSVNQAANGTLLATTMLPWAAEIVVPPGIAGGHAWNLNGAIAGLNYAGASTYTGLIATFANKYSGN